METNETPLDPPLRHAAVVYHITLHYEIDDLLNLFPLYASLINPQSIHEIAKHYRISIVEQTHTHLSACLSYFALYGICQVQQLTI